MRRFHHYIYELTETKQAFKAVKTENKLETKKTGKCMLSTSKTSLFEKSYIEASPPE